MTLSFGIGGTTTLTCVLTPRPLPVDPTLTVDSLGKTLSTATDLGSLSCGTTVTQSGTIFPMGSIDWLRFSWISSASCSHAVVTLVTSDNLLFYLWTSGGVMYFGASGVNPAYIPTAGTFYISVFGENAPTGYTGSYTGRFTVTVSIVP